MEELTTKELFGKLQERIILNLKDNEIACPHCKGLRFVYVQEGDKSYVDPCKLCFTGKRFTCNHCGSDAKTNYCGCEKARKVRNDNQIRFLENERFEKYKTAQKIHYKDYDGKFIIDEKVVDIDDVAEWIEGLIIDKEDVPEFLWATSSNPQFSIDIYDYIKTMCEDGYEGMYDFLDTNSYLLKQAQLFIHKWEKEQGESLYLYTETTTKAVIIKDLTDKIRRERECQ
jgi:hypothetical protein